MNEAHNVSCTGKKKTNLVFSSVKEKVSLMVGERGN